MVEKKNDTFYLLVGEAIVTLQNVADLLGLRIDGDAAVSPVMNDVSLPVRN